jgi:hypothetical protein
MEIKIGRKIFTLTEKDVIFNNGFCCILMTQTVMCGWSRVNPSIAKTTFKKLLKNGDIVLVKEVMEYVTSDGQEVWKRYYKIKVKKNEG